MTDLSFPSEDHRAELVTQRKGYGLTDGEREMYHAYVYGFRRVMLGNFARTSPVDPEGTWFRPQRVEQVEAMYRAKFARPKPQATLFDPPSTASAEEVAEWERQRRELAKLGARITGNGKLHDGSPSPEAIAFVELACQFARANLAGFVSGNRRAATDAELAAIQAGLGITATEQEKDLGQDAAE